MPGYGPPATSCSATSLARPPPTCSGGCASLGLYEDGSVVVTDRAYGEVRGSWSFYAFLTLATTIASVAVITDSAILVIGAPVLPREPR